MIETFPDNSHIKGIANHLFQVFYSYFDDDRLDILAYFSEDALLHFNGNKASGHTEISQMLDSIPSSSTNPTGYDVQPVPDETDWAMIIIFGSMQIGDDNISDFHSTFYVQFNETTSTALIQYCTITVG